MSDSRARLLLLSERLGAAYQLAGDLTSDLPDAHRTEDVVRLLEALFNAAAELEAIAATVVPERVTVTNENFEALLIASTEEALAIARGERRPARKTTFEHDT